MERLIDADALYELLDGGYDIDLDELPETKAELLRMIDHEETIDAEPVRHGRWIIDDGCSYCSVCRNNFKKAIMNHAKYCPMCGAKMDGERRKNNV